MVHSFMHCCLGVLFAAISTDLVQAQTADDLLNATPYSAERTAKIRVYRDRCSTVDSAGLIYACKTSDLVRDINDEERRFIEDPKATIIISGIDDCSDISKCNVSYDRSSRSFVLLFPRKDWFTEDFSVDIVVVKSPK